MSLPRYRLFNGDSLEILGSNGREHQFRDEDGRLMSRDANTSAPWRGVDAVVADPPYGFDFAGSDEWDSFSKISKTKTNIAEDALAFASFTRDWADALRPQKSNIIKPGAHMLVFSADRTIDLVGLGLREGQFDIVRLMFWLYSTGQVKNKTDLRPGCEPIFVARVPFDGSLTALHKKDGLGQLNAQVWKAEDGRHPTNMLIDETVYEDTELAEMVAKAKAPFFAHKSNANARLDRDWGCRDLPFVEKDSKLSHMSTTNEATKASKHLEDGTHAPVMAQNYHPTVKSIDLMRRLIRLVTRPDHVVLDTFMGSGTTGVAAILEGRRFIGIEREPKFFEIARTRIESALMVYEGKATFEEMAGAKEPKAA